MSAIITANATQIVQNVFEESDNCQDTAWLSWVNRKILDTLSEVYPLEGTYNSSAVSKLAKIYVTWNVLDIKGQQLTLNSVQDVIDTMSPVDRGDVNGIKDCIKVLLTNIPKEKYSTY